MCIKQLQISVSFINDSGKCLTNNYFEKGKRTFFFYKRHFTHLLQEKTPTNNSNITPVWWFNRAQSLSYRLKDVWRTTYQTIYYFVDTDFATFRCRPRTSLPTLLSTALLHVGLKLRCPPTSMFCAHSTVNSRDI